MSAGVIFVNLDLLTKMDNEGEIAFILAHEMSHDIKDHVVGSLVKLDEIQQSKEFKDELKRLEKQEFNKFRALVTLKLKYLSKYTGHNRGYELQADSLGFVLFANAGYDPYQAAKTMRILDSADFPALRGEIDYNTNLNFPSFPFKKSWLEPEEEESIGGNLKDLKFPDSLKTHPDCKERAEKLEKMAVAVKKTDLIGKPDRYGYFRNKASFELIEYMQEEDMYGEALYASLELLKVYPENIYLKSSVVNCLYELYWAQKEHYFSLVTDFPDNRQIESYNKFLVFLHNINSETMKNLAVNYFNANLNKSNESPFAGYVALLLKSIEMSNEEKAKLPAMYNSAYKDEYFFKLLNAHFKPKTK